MLTHSFLTSFPLASVNINRGPHFDANFIEHADSYRVVSPMYPAGLLCFLRK